jgi:FAD/FMN-containing dehydrogenase
MTLSSRRQFRRRTSLGAAALYGTHYRGLAAATRVFEDCTQNVAGTDAASIRRFASQTAGHVITPEMPDYDSSRLVFNRAFDRHPALIVRCAGASDVALALDFAQSHNLPLAVRGGGHSRLGYGICDGGVVIDLSGMKRVEVDSGKRVARAEAGALVRDLDEATQRFGLATTSGGCPSVGIAGLTLGGGEGRLMEKYGTACDNLLSAEVVTLDGRRVEASQKSNADLFWAIRGGGGNFGVVTALEYQLHSIGQVVSGALTYPTGRIAELLQGFVRFLAGAPDELDAYAQLLLSQQGRILKIDVCYCGDPEMASGAVRSGVPSRAFILVPTPGGSDRPGFGRSLSVF